MTPEQVLIYIGLGVWILAGLQLFRWFTAKFTKKRLELGETKVNAAVADIVDGLQQTIVNDRKAKDKKSKLSDHDKDALKRAVDVDLKNYASYWKIKRQLGLKNKKAAQKVVRAKVEARVGALKKQ